MDTRTALVTAGLGALLLTACNSEGEKAEERFEIVQENVMAGGDVCGAARQVAGAYLDDGDDENYRKWLKKAEYHCVTERQ